jgi:prepilin-type N-terminal cleavage/methylation domain-containing protein
MDRNEMRRRNRRRDRQRRQGMTLVEIMAVLVIIALVAGGVGFAILPNIERAKIKQTRIDAKAITSAATMYMADYNECPTVQQLLDDKILDKNKSTKDAWDNDFNIECDEDGPLAVSAGPDKQLGTDDDIY